jgi:hypothetical protein
MPGFSLNCLRTSFTIAPAALPTAFIAIAENTKAIIPPMKRPHISIGFIIWSSNGPTKSRIEAADALTFVNPMKTPSGERSAIFPTQSLTSST